MTNNDTDIYIYIHFPSEQTMPILPKNYSSTISEKITSTLIIERMTSLLTIQWEMVILPRLCNNENCINIEYGDDYEYSLCNSPYRRR